MIPEGNHLENRGRKKVHIFKFRTQREPKCQYFRTKVNKAPMTLIPK